MTKQLLFWVSLFLFITVTTNGIKAQQPEKTKKELPAYEGAVIGKSDKTVVEQNKEQIREASEAVLQAEGDGRISLAEVDVLNKIRKEKAASKY